MTQKYKRTHVKIRKHRKANRLLKAVKGSGSFFSRIFRRIKEGDKRAAAAAAVAVLVVLAFVIIAILSPAFSRQAFAPSDAPENTITSSPSPTSRPVYLVQGDRDPLLTAIQDRLMDLGFMDPAESADYFSQAVLDAVKLFQRQIGNEQTGIIDDSLYSAIMSVSAESYALAAGNEGDDVAEAQERLYQLSYFSDKKSVTGHFGTDTQDAVKKFQSTNGLEADGTVNARTFEMLYSPEAKANIISAGEKSDMVRKYQQELLELAYLTTRPDGKYGKDTVAAVRTFQDKNGLVADGYLGPATRELIDSGRALPNDLSIGDSGDTVKSVQRILVKANCLKSASATGYYGTLTEAAVRLFQQTNNIIADGKVGKQTMAVLAGGKYKKAKAPITSGDGSAAPSNDKVKEMLALARSKMGCPYVHGAKGPDKFDCTGFVYWILNHIKGFKTGYLTPYRWRTAGKYTKITSLDDIKPGDIIVFHINGLESTRGHVGIASSDTNMIHAINDSVKETSYKQKYWKDRFVCAWRIF